MWVKQWLPVGNGNHTTYRNGDDWGMVYMALFYPHSNSHPLLMIKTYQNHIHVPIQIPWIPIHCYWGFDDQQ